ncbi:MAG: hypothetical protein ACRDHZ_24050, partial [Ktedonobacteraceae bacterium]
DEGLSVREITKDLLHGKFDARAYFSRKRSYAAQRMLSTGQMPTPLPPIHGILSGERHTPNPLTQTGPISLRNRRSIQPPTTTEPLTRTGPQPVPTGSRTDALQRIANQTTLIGTPAGFIDDDAQEVWRQRSTRQFIAPVVTHSQKQTDPLGNPHPSRSLWHYTGKQPIVKPAHKGKSDV